MTGVATSVRPTASRLCTGEEPNGDGEVGRDRHTGDRPSRAIQTRDLTASENHASNKATEPVAALVRATAVITARTTAE